MDLKERIKRYRKANKLTLEEVAHKIGVSKQTVQKYENGIISNIPSDRIEAMAKVFNCTPADLMGWEDLNEKESKDITFDDFTYAFLDESKELTEENKQKLLEMAKFFKQQQDKENNE